MINPERFENQSGIIAPEKLTDIGFTVIGAGAIGSFFTMTLAKMGATTIRVIDNDLVEEHNIANQIYPTNTIGHSKVSALKDMVKNLSGVDIETTKDNWTPKTVLSTGNVVVSALDNMDTRKALWDSVKGSARYFVDGRMGALAMRVYVVDLQNKDQMSFYEKSLYSSAQAIQERCTFKSIIFTVQLVSGLMLNLLKKALNGEKRPTEIVYDCVNDIQVATYK